MTWRTTTWLRGLAGIALLLVGCVEAAYWLGEHTPREHHAFASGVVHASQAHVWEVMTNPAMQAGWRTGVMQASPVIHNDPAPGADHRHCWVEWTRFDHGLMYCLDSQVPGVRRVVSLDASWLGYGARWTYELRPIDAETTQVMVTQDGYVDRPFLRFVGRYVLGGQTNVKQYVVDLRAEAVREAEVAGLR